MVKSPAVLEKDPGLTSSTLGTAHNCNSSTRQVCGTDTHAGKTLIHIRDKMKQVNQGTLGRGRKNGSAGTADRSPSHRTPGVFYQDSSVKQRYSF